MIFGLAYPPRKVVQIGFLVGCVCHTIFHDGKGFLLGRDEQPTELTAPTPQPYIGMKKERRICLQPPFGLLAIRAVPNHTFGSPLCMAICLLLQAGLFVIRFTTSASDDCPAGADDKRDDDDAVFHGTNPPNWLRHRLS